MLISFVCINCNRKELPQLLMPHKQFIEHITSDRGSFYYVHNNKKRSPQRSDAIGIFDSGIGGLTVFDAVITSDFFNSINENKPDGLNDFQNEQFLYLADQANMPYSNYVEEGKQELLVEHILKDALFLLNNKYHMSARSPEIAKDKPDIKVLVIGCNTATAYGKKHIEEMLKLIDADIKVIGVIDAGCKGALEVTGSDEDAVVAIFATPATVSSLAYVNTLKDLAGSRTGKITIIQQGGKGLHESIDNKPEFINTGITGIYNTYQGPSLWDRNYRIEKSLLPYYNFDTTANRILFNKQSLIESDTILLNSVENYARYHIVSLVEQLKEKGNSVPLKAIILGCTHYPLVTDKISEILSELKLTERYGSLIADTVHIIDPALNTARELYRHLKERDLFNEADSARLRSSRFFVSVPNIFEPTVKTEGDMRFNYDYQYKIRNINELKDFTMIVPLSEELISEEQLNLIQQRLPYTYKLLN